MEAQLVLKAVGQFNYKTKLILKRNQLFNLNSNLVRVLNNKIQQKLGFYLKLLQKIESKFVGKDWDSEHL